jgi:hypothetical protein
VPCAPEGLGKAAAGRKPSNQLQPHLGNPVDSTTVRNDCKNHITESAGGWRRPRSSAVFGMNCAMPCAPERLIEGPGPPSILNQFRRMPE